MVAVLRLYGGFKVPAKVARYKRGQRWWKGESAYNPWTQHQSKELIYLLQRSIIYQNKVLCACSQGDRLVGKDHRSSPTATHKEDNEKINHAPTSSHNGSPYVHATGITNFNTSISKIHNYSTSMTLISPSSYLKTIIKYQTSLSIQRTYKKVFTNLGCLSYQDYHLNLSKLPCCFVGLSK